MKVSRDPSCGPTVCVRVAPCKGYAPHAATRQFAGYSVSTPAERPDKGDEAGGRDWAPSRRSPGTRRRHFAAINFKPINLPDCPQGVRRLPPRPQRTLSRIGYITLALAGSARVIPVLLRDAVLGGGFGMALTVFELLKLFLKCKNIFE